MNQENDKNRLERAVNAVREAAQLGPAFRDKFKDRFPPPMLPMGRSGRFLDIMPDGLEALWQFGHDWRATSEHRRRLSKQRAAQLSVECFGEIVQQDFGKWDEIDYYKLKRQLKTLLNDRLQCISVPVAHYFPCQLLLDPKVGKISVGSVAFMPWNNWLAHVDERRGEASKEMERLRQTNEEYEQLHSKCAWVAAVEIKGNELGRSYERAQIAVRLALDAIGLSTSREQALQLRGPTDQLKGGLSLTFRQLAGADLSWGSHLDAPWMYRLHRDNKRFLSNTKTYREAAGLIIESVISDGAAQLPSLKRRWCDALCWLGESRRSPLGFKTLVCCGFVLDILTGGKKQGGIIELLCALFQKKPEEQFLEDSSSVKSTIRKIYADGRSRLAHGTSPALLEDLPFDISIADEICALTLIGYALCLRRYSGPDDYKKFLHTIPSLVKNEKELLN